MSNLPEGTEYDSRAPWNEKEQEVIERPEVCPICGAPVIHNIYSDECSDFDNCEWYEELPENDNL